MSCELLSDLLARLNAEAVRLQEVDSARHDATGRFRTGAFFYAEKPGPAAGEKS